MVDFAGKCAALGYLWLTSDTIRANRVDKSEAGYSIDIGTKGVEATPPDPERTKDAFSRIGYSLDEAVADLVDNSIDAEATDVLVRLLYDRKSIRRVFIVDNGRGMHEETLRSAMRFGSTLKHKKSDLGKYGIGLKSASLSQCEKFAVITRTGGEVSGRRWSTASFQNNWLCEKLEGSGCRRLLDAQWAGLNLDRSGTIVMWDELTNLQAGDLPASETVNKAILGLASHLGLVFHRFLEKRDKFRIRLDSQFVGLPEFDVAQFVTPLNPFGYDLAGADGYPKEFKTTLAGVGDLTLVGHIWPPKSRKLGYTLGGGKISSRQGFYFYRNDRMIQAGGWNGCRGDDAEPHLSLARVAIDIPPGSEGHFDVMVQKSKVSPPRDFVQAVRNAKAGTTTFAEYVVQAVKVYRSEGKAEKSDEKTLVPWNGLSTSARKNAREVLAPNEGRIRRVNFRWKPLDTNVVFELDRDHGIISLNEIYRQAILGGTRKSRNDARAFKTTLFLLVRGYFDQKPLTRGRVEFLETCNKLLLGGLKG